MPDWVSDVRDFQLVKTRPYPAELKAEAFASIWAESSDEQRRRLLYLFQPGEPSAAYAIDSLCDLFLQADPGEQSRFRNSPIVSMLSFQAISSGVQLIRTHQDIGQLRRRLAAAVLLNGHDDYRDILMALASLWLAAARAGIDPLPYFQEAAHMAGTDDPYGIGSTRDMLANFHTYAIFEAEVVPYLPST